MERHLHEPLTLPKHPELLHEINETSIGIKVHHTDIKASPEDLTKLKVMHKKPTWENMIDLLRRAYNAINEQRENPRRY